MTLQTTMDWGYTLGEEDFYPTPRPVVEALLEHHPPPKDVPLLEPAAGAGAILEVLLSRGYRPDQLFAGELRDTERERLEALLPQGHVDIRDWFIRAQRLHWPWSVLTNPPFSLLPGFMEAARAVGPRYLALLMPIEEVAGVKRSTIFNLHRPTGLVSLSWRPFPNVRGVAWYVWEEDKPPMDLVVV